MIGHIEGINVGSTYTNRQALHDAEIHRGLMRGIAPKGESIVLSGGYVDDIDLGNEIIYTGEGGRDSNTGKQIKDQTLTGGNLALAENHINGNPIRVNRGHKSKSKYSPENGYCYDGLYRIDKYWSENGRDGFLSWRYRLIGLDGQHQKEFTDENIDANKEKESITGNENPGRTTSIVSRVIRNSQVGNEVKSIYNYNCQICNVRIETPSGPYAECCHIKPLGRPHNGPDTLDNVLCLCPNCHVLLDMHALHIDEDITIIETGKKLTVSNDHDINVENIVYLKDLSTGI